MRNRAELEAQLQEMVSSAQGPTFNIDGHAKLLARRYGNVPMDVIRNMLVEELRSRKDLRPRPNPNALPAAPEFKAKLDGPVIIAIPSRR